MNTLAVGKHTLVADIDNNNFGEVSPSIDIIVKAPDSATKTGDDTNMALPIGIAIAALIAVAAVLITRKRHNG